MALTLANHNARFQKNTKASIHNLEVQMNELVTTVGRIEA